MLLDLSMADTDLRLDCPVHKTADATIRISGHLS